MNEIDSALQDIAHLRDRLAASSRFQGFAPGLVAVTGCFAAALGLWQQARQDENLLAWMLLAAVCALLIGIEAVGRARKAHRSMADRMLASTLSRFLPVATAGAILGVVVLVRVPEFAGALPGLWQLLMGIGIFAMLSGLPRLMTIAGAFYFVSGTISLLLSGGAAPSTAWLMAVPFSIGQLLVAAILHLASRELHHG
jgi:hypothetical protein